jgi:hypothetical protein
MKAKLFFLLIAGFALSMLSCNSDPVGTPNDDTTVTYATGTGSDAPTDTIVTPYIPEPPGEPEIYPPLTEYPGPEEGRNPDFRVDDTPHLELVITVDEIKSFNVTTREIVFTDLIFKKFTTSIDECVYDSLTIYYGDKLLFEKIPKTCPVMSNAINDLVLIWFYNESLEIKFHLADGYPEWDMDGEQIMYGDGKPIDWKKIRRENAERRKAEWDIFIKYLTDAGKIVK